MSNENSIEKKIKSEKSKIVSCTHSILFRTSTREKSKFDALMNRLEDQNQNLFYVVKVKLLYFPFICCKEIILSKSTLPAVKQLLATKIFIKYQKIKKC